jgi:hypothetical protein
VYETTLTGVTVQGSGWAAVVNSNYSTLTFSPGSLIISFVCMGIWDSVTANASIGILNDAYVSLPTTNVPPVSAGAFVGPTVTVCQGSSSHISGVSFWAVVKL